MDSVAELKAWISANFWNSAQIARWAENNFFRRKSFLSESSGTGNAGLPLITNSDGKVDSTFIDTDALDLLYAPVGEIDTHIAATAAHGATGAVVGTTNSQTLTNKTLTTPTITLKQGASAAPTAEGDIQWDSDDNQIKVGDGSGTKTFSDDSKQVLLAGTQTITGSKTFSASITGNNGTAISGQCQLGTVMPGSGGINWSLAAGGGGQDVGFDASINDNAAVSFTPPRTSGILEVFTTSLVANTWRGHFRTAATIAIGAQYAGANVDTTTGALTGTTGTDGKMTISVHSDGKIYIENRLGGTGAFRVRLWT